MRVKYNYYYIDTPKGVFSMAHAESYVTKQNPTLDG